MYQWQKWPFSINQKSVDSPCVVKRTRGVGCSSKGVAHRLLVYLTIINEFDSHEASFMQNIITRLELSWFLYSLSFQQAFSSACNQELQRTTPVTEASSHLQSTRPGLFWISAKWQLFKSPKIPSPMTINKLHTHRGTFSWWIRCSWERLGSNRNPFCHANQHRFNK